MSSFLILMSLNFQSCQEATAPEITETTTPMYSLQKNGKLTPKEKEEWTVTLKQIAKGLAILFKEESNKKILENCIKTSKKVEQILEASEFLNQAYNIEVKGQKKNTTFREAIAEVLQENNKTDFNEKIKSLKFGLIDLYFPIKEWRNNWHSNNRLQVASVGWNEQLKDVEVFAFAPDGTESLIPKNIKPAITTLVVYPSEKRGNYKPNKDNYYNALSKSNSIASTNSETSTHSYKVYKILVKKDYEGWFGGTMEIYIHYAYKPKYSGSWIWTNAPTNNNTVNGVKKNVWKTFNKNLVANVDEPYIFKIMMYEWDGWFNGADDLVCDTGYDDVYDEHGHHDLNQPEIYDDNYNTKERQLVDGVVSNHSRIILQKY